MKKNMFKINDVVEFKYKGNNHLGIVIEKWLHFAVISTVELDETGYEDVDVRVNVPYIDILRVVATR